MCLHHLHMLYLPSPLATIETVARSISKVLLFQSRLFQAVLRTRVNDHLARFGLVPALVTANFRLTFPQEGAPGVTSTEEGDTHAGPELRKDLKGHLMGALAEFERDLIRERTNKRRFSCRQSQRVRWREAPKAEDKR